MKIRPESRADYDAVRAVNLSAFETAAESELVDALRDQVSLLVSLVAVQEDHVVGHIMFSPVTIAEMPGLNLMGLAPMAVIPALQRTGVGSELVQHGLAACGGIGAEAVVVLGHPDFYPRFGFRPASVFNINSEYDVPDDVFMAREIVSNSLENVTGTVKYHAVFGEL